MPIKVEGLAPLIQVFDMPTSVAFYRDVLGFEIIGRSAPGDDIDWGLLQLDGAQLMLNTAYEKPYRPPAPNAQRVAAHEDTALYFSCPDVDAAYAHLRAAGIEANPPRVASYGMKQLYVKDPDGYVLCFQWPAS
jgi:catechol 2,3-dioxygenase-like lactoylglutathione lyase family enzyme